MSDTTPEEYERIAAETGLDGDDLAMYVARGEGYRDGLRAATVRITELESLLAEQDADREVMRIQCEALEAEAVRLNDALAQIGGAFRVDEKHAFGTDKLTMEVAKIAIASARNPMHVIDATLMKVRDHWKHHVTRNFASTTTLGVAPASDGERTP